MNARRALRRIAIAIGVILGLSLVAAVGVAVKVLSRPPLSTVTLSL